MSAIFGVWHLDGRPVVSGTLERMSGTLSHRGAGGFSVWSEGVVGLGGGAFRSTPETNAEHRSLVSRDGRLVLTADVRLDNRAEILSALGSVNGSSPGATDAELLIAAYEKWGERCAERLLGDFAFAVWDTERRDLVLVRDHFGIKPLYFCHLPGRMFAFASEVKALLRHPDVPDDIDDLEVARHLLVPVHDDPGSTFHREVRRALPGHVLRVRKDGPRERRYWSLDPERSLELRSDEEYAEAVRAAFLEAVECRLHSSSEVAFMLSGGLDSSSITCSAGYLGKSPGALRTLSAVYPTASASDERVYIDEVAEMYDTNPFSFAADSVSPVADVDRFSWHLDGPNPSGNLYLNWYLYRAAAEGGNHVVLDGFDGDSTVSHGNGRLIELALARRWWTLAREVKALAGATGEPWIPAVRSWLVRYGVRPMARKLMGDARPRRDRGTRAGSWTQMVQEDYGSLLAPHIEARPEPPTTEREHHHRRLSWTGLQRSASSLEAIGAGAGVEVRFPFFDVRLVELCLSLPAEQKLRRGWSRFVMRNAMAGILPEKIRWRPGKSDMSVGFHHALRTKAAKAIERVVESADSGIARYVDPKFVRETHPLFMSGRTSKLDDLYFWRVVSLGLWMIGRDGAAVVDGGSRPGQHRTGPVHRDKPPEEVCSARQLEKAR